MENRAYTDEEMQEAQDMIDNLTAELDECRASKIGYALYTETMDKMRALEAERDALKAEVEFLSEQECVSRSAEMVLQRNEWMKKHRELSAENEQLRGQLARILDGYRDMDKDPSGMPKYHSEVSRFMSILDEIYTEIQQENSDEDHD